MRRAVELTKRISIGIAISFLLVLGLTPAAEAKAAYDDWFQHRESITGAWKFLEVPGDANQVVIKSTKENSADKKRIFVLYPKKSSAYDIAMSKILDVFASKNTYVEFVAFNFDNKDSIGSEVLDRLEKEKFDLVFSMGSQSTAWLHQYYRNGPIPVVTVCSKDPVALGHIDSYDEGSGTNFAFTSLNMPIKVQLAYLMDFKPGLKNLGILVNRGNISAVRTQAKPMQEAALAHGINVYYLGVQDQDNVKGELRSLIGKTIEEMRSNDPSFEKSVFWITGSTTIFREIETINRFAGTVPVLSAVPEVVQAGDHSAVLSIGISFESNGYLAAVYGYDVIMGHAKAGDLEVGIVSPPDIAINFRRAKKIGVEIPFSFFESANFVYDYEGKAVRLRGRDLTRNAGS